MQISEKLVSKTLLFCYKRMSDRDKAQDVAQEIILEALRAKKANGGNDATGIISAETGSSNISIKNFYAWYWKMAANKIADSFRKSDKSVCIDYADSILFSENKEEDVLSDEEIAELSELISHLAKIHRDVLIRFYLKEEGIKQIAQELNIPIGTVTGRLFDAKAHLKRRYQMKEKNPKKETARKFPKLDFIKYTQQEKEYAGINDSLTQSILYCCRLKEKSVKQISEEINASPVYIEDRIKNLLKFNFISEPEKNHYLATFIQLPSSSIMKVYDAQKEIIKKIDYEKRFFDALISVKDKIIAQPFYGNDFDFSLLLWYFIIRTIRLNSNITGEEFCRINDFEPLNVTNENYNDVIKEKTDRQVLAYYFEDFIIDDLMIKNFSWAVPLPGWWTVQTDYYQLQIGVDAPPFPVSYCNKRCNDYVPSRMDWINVTNGYLIFDLINNPQKDLTEKEMEAVADFIKNGVVKKKDGKLKVTIPVCTFEVMDRIDRILNEAYEALRKEFVSEINQVLKKEFFPYINKDFLPSFLQFFAKWFAEQNYALIDYGLKNNLLEKQDDYEHSTASMFILTKKELVTPAMAEPIEATTNSKEK